MFIFFANQFLYLKFETFLPASFLFVLTALSYFYPVIKYSKSKLDCESNAKNYFMQNKNLIKMSKKNLRMLSTNFCNGGKEIDNFRI